MRKLHRGTKNKNVIHSIVKGIELKVNIWRLQNVSNTSEF